MYGPPITRPRWRTVRRSWRWICMSTPITWISVPGAPTTSPQALPRSTGPTRTGFSRDPIDPEIKIACRVYAARYAGTAIDVSPPGGKLMIRFVLSSLAMTLLFAPGAFAQAQWEKVAAALGKPGAEMPG